MITKGKNMFGTRKEEMLFYAPIAERYGEWLRDTTPLISLLEKRELSLKLRVASLDKIAKSLLTLQSDIQSLTYESFSKQMLSSALLREVKTKEE